MNPKHVLSLNKLYRLTLVLGIVALIIKVSLSLVHNNYIESKVPPFIEQEYVKVGSINWEAQPNYVLEGTYNYPYTNSIRIALVADYERDAEWAIKMYSHDDENTHLITSELNRLRNPENPVGTDSKIILHKLPDRIKSDNEYLIWFVPESNFDLVTRALVWHNNIDSYLLNVTAVFLAPVLPFIYVPYFVSAQHPLIGSAMLLWFFIISQISLRFGKKYGVIAFSFMYIAFYIFGIYMFLMFLASQGFFS
jgi:hypothetical protein